MLWNMSTTSLKSERENVLICWKHRLEKNQTSQIYIPSSWEPPLNKQCLFRFRQNRNKLKQNLLHFLFSFHPSSSSVFPQHDRTPYLFILVYATLLTNLGRLLLSGLFMWKTLKELISDGMAYVSFSPYPGAILRLGSLSLYFQFRSLACLYMMVSGLVS